ncbi:hypothetical protein M8J77_005463 [Diaphorina citri]|nr:hypothetical protein M8J77_005463 [Diaphorina citri]
MYKHLVKMSLNKKIEVIHDPYVRDMCLDIVNIDDVLNPLFQNALQAAKFKNHLLQRGKTEEVHKHAAENDNNSANRIAAKRRRTTLYASVHMRC